MRLAPRIGSTPAQTTSYAYNAADALASVALPGSATAVTYTADGDNLRQSRTKGAATTRYLWDVSGSLPLLVEAGSTSYLYGPSHTPLAQIDSAGNIDYLHADLIGSTRMTTSGSGVVTSTNAYDPFGKRTHTGTKDSAFGFSGNLTDVDTGLIYMRARDYDPRTGQFLTVDPALYFTGDPYAYVSNNPLLRIDPTGLWDLVSDVIDPLAVSMMRGSLAGATSAIVGFGDGASLGFTDLFRESVGTNCVVDKGSWYFGGGVVGVAGITALSGLVSGGASAAGAANTTVAISRPSSRVLGANLEAAGTIRPAGSAAHHIVAGNAKSAAQSRATLQRLGIDINDASNGVFLPGRLTSPNPTGAAVHSTIHTNAYYQEVNRLVVKSTSPAGATDVLNLIRSQLLSGGFPR
ncbi:RHS repeat-associated core domain-containing protein [Rhodoglobus sp.]